MVCFLWYQQRWGALAKIGDIMFKRFFLLIVAVSIGIGAPASAQEPFYKAKTIRIIVGFAPGGGYDLYSRVMARHMGRHVPGSPTIVVENMEGAGSRIAVNHVYAVAKPDGLAIGHFIGGLFVQQLLGDPGIKFDARRFEYIGVPAQDNYMLGISKATGIKTMDEWLASKKVLKFGGVAPGTATDDIPKILKATIGLPVQIVSGYKGTGPIRLAFDSGEIEGLMNAWESFKATWSKQLEAGDVIIVLQNISQPHPELPKVPLAINYAKTEEARKLIHALVHTMPPTARPYVLPPGTPKQRVEILRKAFMDTMKDPEFLADAKKAKLDINPLAGAELERNVKEVFNLEPALVPKAKEILK
jgi:tripartite-type tricarboxylate transporter receptor subunit TctC